MVRKKTKGQLILLGIICVIALFFRVYNLDQNSRFIWDESRALVDMHRIWEEKEITFVGPISEDNLEMFPSLTYYLLLPFAVLGDFDPLSPVVGSIIMGVLVWAVITFLAKRHATKQKWLIASLLIAVFYPFVLTSRWAWNPNPILFWAPLSVALLFLARQSLLTWFFAGFFMWLTIYHHYLSAIIAIPATIFIYLLSKNKKNTKAYWLGSLVSLLPIAFFEIKNHYFANWLGFSRSGGSQLITLDWSGYIDRVISALTSFSSIFLLEGWAWMIVFYLLMVTTIYFTRKKKVVKYTTLVFVISMLGAGIITNINPHYLYALVPFVLFLFINLLFFTKHKLSYLPVLILIIFSIYNSINLVTSYTWQGDVQAVRNATKVILADKTKKRINVASLASPDINTTGQRYRDMTLIQGLTLDPSNEYPNSQVLYVISKSSDEDVIRNDPAWEMETFKKIKLTDKLQISNYPFYIYRFEK